MALRSGTFSSISSSVTVPVEREWLLKLYISHIIADIKRSGMIFKMLATTGARHYSLALESVTPISSSRNMPKSAAKSVFVIGGAGNISTM